MTSSRFPISDSHHCDDETLDRILQAPIHDNSDPAIAHLEDCEACQQRLEARSKTGLTWDEVADLLDEAIGPTVGQSSCDSAVAERPLRLPEFLTPSTHPESKGRFGRYEIMDVLGRGGMGIVMRGYDGALDRHCAIKVLTPEFATSAAARIRFSREARNAAAVVHQHVVPIQTVDDQDGLPFLVMPVIEGRSLEERVRSDGPLTAIEVVRIASQVADGLAAAHSQGLIHRDIKPANILLERDVERVQITDFGLARAADDASMTRSGVIAGTPQYMSPEQAHGDDLDCRSDLFSLGSVMYFMLTGRSPFRAQTTMGVLNRIANDEPRSLRSINADIPQWLEAIVMKLLSKSAADRFETASDVSTVLDNGLAHLQQPAVNAAPKSPIVRGRLRSGWSPLRRWVIATVAAVVCFAAGMFIVLETDKGTITIESDAAVSIRIRQGQRVVQEISVEAGETSTSMKSGRYMIEIDGPPDQYHLDGENVAVLRGSNELVKIRIEEPAAVADSSTKSAGTGISQSHRPLPSDTQQHATFDPTGRIQPGDTIAVRIPSILPPSKLDYSVPPPVVNTYRSGVTAIGYPLVVAHDGTLRLPWMTPVEVVGKSLREVEAAIQGAYAQADVLNSDAPVMVARVDSAATHEELRIAAFDTVVVYLPGLLPDDDHQAPPITKLDTGQIVTGYPLTVDGDGTIQLPYLSPIKVRGLNVRGVERKIRDAVIKRNILNSDASVPVVIVVKQPPTAAK